MAQWDAHLNGDLEVGGLIPTGFILSWIDHEYFSTVLLSLPLVQVHDSIRAFVSFWLKNLHKYWLTAWRTRSAQLYMTLMG